jgi:hypothetical protein
MLGALTTTRQAFKNAGSSAPFVPLFWYKNCYLVDTFMKTIVSGVSLIVVGLLIGDSIFQGHFGITSIVFDGLGFFFIGKGAYTLWRDKQQSQA